MESDDVKWLREWASFFAVSEMHDIDGVNAETVARLNRIADELARLRRIIRVAVSPEALAELERDQNQ